MSKTRVLIVDDSPFIHKAITRALSSDDYEICGIAGNGRDGVELYKSSKPDVVTMDVTMPILDGIGAARQIMGLDPGAKIVMLSAMGDDELIAEAGSHGITQFLKKPFKPDQLIEAIEKVRK